jgi:DNA-binding protein H-NS
MSWINNTLRFTNIDNVESRKAVVLTTRLAEANTAFFSTMGGASEKSATMLVLALTAALLPILIQLLAKMQQEIKQRKKEEAEREALTVADVTLMGATIKMVRVHQNAAANHATNTTAQHRLLNKTTSVLLQSLMTNNLSACIVSPRQWHNSY